MKSVISLFTITFFALFMLGCSNPATKKNKQKTSKDGSSETLQKESAPVNYITLNDSVKKSFVLQGQDIARQTTSVLQKNLKKAIQENGLEYALHFCNIRAMDLTDSISKADSVQIRRLAKKYRNPVNETNPEESDLFKSYILDWLGGKPLSARIIPDNEGHPVFYEPIYVGTVCLNCHGEPGKNMSPELTETIQKLYPNDKAVNFKKGQLRGMWAITFTNYEVK